MSFFLNRLIPWTFPVALIVAYVWSSIAATAAPQITVGSVEELQGKGWGVSEWGQKYDKLGGDLVTADEIVATGINSAMTMRFIDNTAMTLGENAEITIDEMVYNPEDGDNDSVTLKLGKGSFYFVSGLVAKEKVTIITPTATIGIRGTELVIDVAEDGTTSVGVAKGHAFMRSHRDGRSVEVEVGNTARTDKKGRVSDPFPGIDLTGEEDVDRKIPGVAEWLDEDEKKDDEDEKDLTEFASNVHEGDFDEIGKGEDGRDEEDGEMLAENEGDDDIVRRGEETEDEDESDDDRKGDEGEGDEGEGDDGGEGREGGDDGDDSDDGDSDDGGDDDGGDDGDREGSDHGDRDRHDSKDR